jgi:hypothetical protein
MSDARVIWLIVMCVCLSLSAAARANAAQGNPEGLFVEVDGRLLTVKAKEIPHRQILEEIAKQLNFELIIDGPLEERYSLDLERIPWEEALKRALSPANWAFIYQAGAQEPRLLTVFVLQLRRDKGATDNPPAAPGRADPLLSPPSTQPSEAQVPGAPEHEQKGLNASLTELLKAEDQVTRVAAINSIAVVGGEKAVDALKQALQDQEPWVRLEAVEALKKIPGEQAIEVLEQALGDEHPYVQQAAQEALASLHRGGQ